MAINEALVAEYNVAKATLAAAQERFDKIENDLCQSMLVEEIKSDLVHVQDMDYQVTVVAGETAKIDSAGLKDYLGAVKFRKICKPPKADAKLIEAAVKSGLLPIDVVAEHVTYTANKPFLRVTKVDANHAD